MANYQRITVATGAEIGGPAPLPEPLVGLTDETLADLSSVLNADACEQLGFTGLGFLPVPDPEPEPQPRNVSALAFMQRLTPIERIAIRTEAKTDVAVEDYLDLLSKATLVDLDHADTVNGLAFLVSKGLLTSERAAEVRE